MKWSTLGGHLSLNKFHFLVYSQGPFEQQKNEGINNDLQVRKHKMVNKYRGNQFIMF